MKSEFGYQTEAELCVDFTAWAQRYGWTVYPETAGWDLLLVDADGRQLGVEAKLRLNAKVIDQAMPALHAGSADVGPHHRAILVPELSGGFCDLLTFIGIEIFYGQRSGYRSYRDQLPCYSPAYFNRYAAYQMPMFDWNPRTPHPLPEYRNEQPAGVPAPITLSDWKIGALKVLAWLAVKGWIHRTEVAACGCDPRRFCARDGWLLPLGEGRWGPGTVPRFDAQHPEVYATILAKVRAQHTDGVIV